MLKSTTFIAKQDLTRAEEWPWQLGSALRASEWRPLGNCGKARRRLRPLARRPGASSVSKALFPWRPHTGQLRSTRVTMVLSTRTILVGRAMVLAEAARPRRRATPAEAEAGLACPPSRRWGAPGWRRARGRRSLARLKRHTAPADAGVRLASPALRRCAAVRWGSVGWTMAARAALVVAPSLGGRR